MSIRSRGLALLGLVGAGLLGLVAWLDRVSARAVGQGGPSGTVTAGSSPDGAAPRPRARDAHAPGAPGHEREHLGGGRPDDGAGGESEQPGPVAVGRRVARKVMQDDIIGLSAELAYRFFLALFPFAIFLTSLGSFVAANLPIQDPTERIIEALQGAMPAEAATLVGNEIRAILERQETGLLSFSALAALFFATGGMNAIIKSMNRTYGVEEGRPIWKRYIVAILLTLIAGAFVIVAFALLVPARILAGDIAQAIGLGASGPLVVTVAAFVAAFLLLTGAVSLLYRIAPNLELPVKAILPGALFFVVAWIAVTLGFGFYVSNFGNYNATYGALAGVAIMLIWFYASGFVLLLGAEINQVVHELMDPMDIQRRRLTSAAADDPEEGTEGTARSGEERPTAA